MTLLLALALASAAQAQLNGVYTCANGNPGNAFDYGSIGDFFNALEAQGVLKFRDLGLISEDAHWWRGHLLNGQKYCAIVFENASRDRVRGGANQVEFCFPFSEGFRQRFVERNWCFGFF
jgi:hypothetical protein